jgi:hypothetical protein
MIIAAGYALARSTRPQHSSISDKCTRHRCAA